MVEYKVICDEVRTEFYCCIVLVFLLLNYADESDLKFQKIVQRSQLLPFTDAASSLLHICTKNLIRVKQLCTT